jgi:hypothetical protein
MISVRVRRAQLGRASQLQIDCEAIQIQLFVMNNKRSCVYVYESRTEGQQALTAPTGCER